MTDTENSSRCIECGAHPADGHDLDCRRHPVRASLPESSGGSVRKKGLLVSLAGLVLAGLVVLVLGVSGAFSGVPRGTVSVRMQLLDMQSYYAGCAGQGGYSDINAGAPVVIRDEAGKVIAAGELGRGSVQNGNCTWTARVAGVPLNRQFYSVEVSHRGQVTESRSQLAESNWTFQLSLGSLLG